MATTLVRDRLDEIEESLELRLRTASDRSKDTERIMIFAALVEIEKTRKIAEMNRTLSELSRRLSE